MIEYDDRYPQAPLDPADPARRDEMRVVIDWFNRVCKLAPNAIAAALDSDAPDQARIAALADEIARPLDRFEALLGGREHLMGDTFSAADCASFPFLKYALTRDPADDELFHRVLDDDQRVGEHTRAWRRGSGAWMRVGAHLTAATPSPADLRRTPIRGLPRTRSVGTVCAA